MQWYRRLLQYLTPYRTRFILGLCAGVLYAITNAALIGTIKFSGDYIFPVETKTTSVEKVDSKKFVLFRGMEKRLAALKDRASAKLYKVFPEPQRDLSPKVTLCIALLIPLVFFLKGFFNFLNVYLLNWVGVRVTMDIRTRLFVHVQELSLSFFNRSSTGDLMARISHDTNEVQKSLVNVIADAVKQPLTLLISAALLVTIDATLSMLALIMIPLCLVPIFFYGRKVRKASKESQKNLGQLVSLMHEAFSGIRVVKAFGREDAEIKKFQKNTGTLVFHTMRVVRSNSILSPTIEVFGAVAGSLVLVYAYVNKLPPSHVVAFMGAMFVIYNPVKSISKLHLTLQAAAASAERIFEVLDEPKTVVDAKGSAVLPVLAREIKFDNVTFAYDKHPVISEFSLVIPRGAFVALVGPSGGGKTSIINLLCRFYDPTSGRVLLDGLDLREVTQLSLRRQIGMVTQETFLFNTTIAANIAYGKPEATREEIVRAAKLAHAHDFISAMPEGYDSNIGERGVQLSGGQRQRLSIARAILPDPAILILDEATSALDSESERLVQEALDEVSQGRTVISIAHRLSTIQKAGLIVVLEQGKIVEQGTLLELLENKGVFARLWDQQITTA